HPYRTQRAHARGRHACHRNYFDVLGVNPVAVLSHSRWTATSAPTAPRQHGMVSHATLMPCDSVGLGEDHDSSARCRCRMSDCLGPLSSTIHGEMAISRLGDEVLPRSIL